MRISFRFPDFLASVERRPKNVDSLYHHTSRKVGSYIRSIIDTVVREGEFHRVYVKETRQNIGASEHSKISFPLTVRKYHSFTLFFFFRLIEITIVTSEVGPVAYEQPSSQLVDNLIMKLDIHLKSSCLPKKVWLLPVC